MPELITGQEGNANIHCVPRAVVATGVEVYSIKYSTLWGILHSIFHPILHLKIGGGDIFIYLVGRGKL